MPIRLLIWLNEPGSHLLFQLIQLRASMQMHCSIRSAEAKEIRCKIPMVND